MPIQASDIECICYKSHTTIPISCGCYCHSPTEVKIPIEILKQGMEEIIKFCADNKIDIAIPVPKGL